MKKLFNYKYSIIAALFALIFYIIVFLTNADLTEKIIIYLQKFDHYEIDELLFVSFIISMGFIIDVMLKKFDKEQKLLIEQQKLNVLKSTTRTMQDVINNLVIALQYLRNNSEETKTIDNESLKMIDELITSATEKINALGNLDSINEKEIYSGVSVIDYEKKLKNKTLEHENES